MQLPTASWGLAHAGSPGYGEHHPCATQAVPIGCSTSKGGPISDRSPTPTRGEKRTVCDPATLNVARSEIPGSVVKPDVFANESARNSLATTRVLIKAHVTRSTTLYGGLPITATQVKQAQAKNPQASKSKPRTPQASKPKQEQLLLLQPTIPTADPKEATAVLVPRCGPLNFVLYRVVI